MMPQNENRLRPETQMAFQANDRNERRLSVIMMKSSNATGSRYQNGNVPNVNWNSDNGKLNVNAYNPQNANDNLRARAEVSGKPRDKRGFSNLNILSSHLPSSRFPANVFRDRYTFSR
jgi:hypothetical protein